MERFCRCYRRSRQETDSAHVCRLLSLESDVLPANNGMVKCSGTARVLKGNAGQIGSPGGWDGPNVRPHILVTANGAAIIPSQWGVTNKATFRPYLNQISGTFPGTGVSFQGVSEIIGGAPDPHYPNLPVQQGLMADYPSMLIIELPGGRDLGVNGTPVNLTVPSAVGCPAGTSVVQ